MTKYEDIPALLVIDMVNDNFDAKRNLSITKHAQRIIDPINQISKIFRQKGWPVVFSTDAFHEDDFIFSSAMPWSPIALKGPGERT